MKDVTELLQVAEEIGEYRVFFPFHFGDGGRVRVSVQASRHTYCSPRATLANLSEYTHFEVMANVPRGDLPDAWWDYYSNPIHAYVPKQLINDLIAKLSEKYGLIFPL